MPAASTADAFIAKWTRWNGHERQGYQEHFRDLCALLGQDPPHDPATYCFEKGVTKTSGSRGWADVWKRGHFAVEYKAKGANLEAALAQLQQYALALESPPLLVVSDFERFLIVSSFTNAVSERRLVRIDELRDPKTLDLLRRLFTDPESFRPSRTRQDVTEEVAREVGEIVRDLRAKGHDPQKVADGMGKFPGSRDKVMMNIELVNDSPFEPKSGAIVQRRAGEAVVDQRLRQRASAAKRGPARRPQPAMRPGPPPRAVSRGCPCRKSQRPVLGAPAAVRGRGISSWSWLSKRDGG